MQVAIHNCPLSMYLLPMYTKLPDSHCSAPSQPALKSRTIASFEVYHMTAHLLPPVGSLGFCDFSICPIMSSNALVTFSLYRALASVHAQAHFSASCLPSSGVTWRCSGRRSLLLPTITTGTHSVPYVQVSKGVQRSGPALMLPDDLESFL